MRKKKKKRYGYNRGGILEVLAQPRVTKTLGDLTDDKVARDLRRSEGEAPSMDLSAPGVASLGGLRSFVEDRPERPVRGGILPDERILSRLRKQRAELEGPRLSLQEGGQVAPAPATETRTSVGESRNRGLARRMAMARVHSSRGKLTNTDFKKLPNGNWRFELTYTVPKGRQAGGLIGLRKGGKIPGYFFGGLQQATGAKGGWGGAKPVGSGGLGMQQPGGGGMDFKPTGQANMQQPGGGWGGAKPVGGGGLGKPLASGMNQPMGGGMQQPGGGWGLAGTKGGAPGGPHQPMGGGFGGPGQAPHSEEMVQTPQGLEPRSALIGFPGPPPPPGQQPSGGGWGNAKPVGGGGLGKPGMLASGINQPMPGGLLRSGYQQEKIEGFQPSEGDLGLRGRYGGPGQPMQGLPYQGSQTTLAVANQSPPGGAPGSSPWMGGPPPGQAPPGQAPPGQAPPAFQPYQPQALPEGYGGPAQYKGYGGPESMGVRQEFVSPEVASQYADLTESIMNIGTRPYEQYQGPQLASFTPAEAAAQAAFTAYGTGQGPQGTLQAESTLDQAAQSTADLAPQQARVGQKYAAYAPLAQEQAQASAEAMRETGEAAGDPELQREADLDPYQSQFVQGAIDPKIRAIREEAARQRSELGSQAAQAGAFGSYRHGLGEQAAGQAAAQQIADVTGEGYQKAFESAQQAFQADRAAQQQGLQQQQQAQQAAGQMEQTGIGTMANLFGGEQAALGAQAATAAQMAGIGGQQAALGGQQQAELFSRLNQMQRAGASRRQLQQAALDIQKQQWQQQRQHPEKQAQWISQMLGALPYQNIVQEGTYTPQAGPVSSTIGAGVHGLGMWNAWQANQPGGDQGDAAAAGGGQQDTYWDQDMGQWLPKP